MQELSLDKGIKGSCVVHTHVMLVCNITLTKGSSLEWTDLRLALGNTSLTRNSVKQLRIL